ncbi:hypothetical protein P8452_19190 [Trifolium repens]|nr:hypothetical protein P8452_19190 [Trifolium repens]
MATVVGEAFLAASLEVLLEKIVSGEFGELFRSTKLDNELLGKLEITLVSLQAVLHDAEEKQITNPAVKQWLDMIRDAVFEAGDLFDEINTEALRRRVEAEYETRSATAQVLKKLSSPFKRFNKKINSKLQKLFERLEHLRKQNLGLKDGVISNSVWHGTPTSSVNSNSKQVGFSRKLTNFPFSVTLILFHLHAQGRQNRDPDRGIGRFCVPATIHTRYFPFRLTFSNTTIVMTFSSSLRFRKGVTNFLKICFYSILYSGMTCVGTELVKDTAKILKEIISSSMSGIVCITQHHSIDISLKTIRFGPNRFMSARLEQKLMQGDYNAYGDISRVIDLSDGHQDDSMLILPCHVKAKVKTMASVGSNLHGS